MRFLLFITLSIICAGLCEAQTESQVSPHSPKKATLRSAVLPGWGQVYNKKYWKVPVIYAGFGGLTFMFIQNDREYQRYKQDYLFATDGDSTTVPSVPGLNPSIFKENRDFYQRYRDLAVIGMALWWAFQVIDANVDAHLYEFDISSDLSLNIRPDVLRTATVNAAPGLCFQLRIGK